MDSSLLLETQGVFKSLCKEVLARVGKKPEVVATKLLRHVEGGSNAVNRDGTDATSVTDSGYSTPDDQLACCRCIAI